MARGNNEIIPLLVDTKNTIERAVKDVGSQVADGNRDLAQQLTDTVSSLQAINRETRDRAVSTANKAGQTATEITHLKQEIGTLRGEVSTLRGEVSTLRTVVEELAALLREAPAPPSKPDQTPAASFPPPAPAAAAAPAAQPGPAPTVTLTLPGPSGGTTGQDAAPPVLPTQRDGAHDTAPPVAQAPEAGTGVGPAEEPDSQTEEDQENREVEEHSAPAADTPAKELSPSHGALLLKAAQIGRLHLVCHRDTWDFIAARASGHEHFRPTAPVAGEADGMVRATLSGRSLIGLLISLYTVQQEDRVAGEKGDWAMALSLYNRIGENLFNAHSEGSTPLTIVFDDGITTPAPAPQDSPDAPRE
ncbi:hypothetical protein [Streptomyces mangrovi]|uniref:hypothetical protein n=1 Tax=Streptomyces mangrovi TaxID=1206892 RepID=UPI00399D362C